MADSAPDHGQLVFGHLNALVRASTLYPATHPQMVKARETLHGALTAYLAAHGTLTYWFLGDVLVANERMMLRHFRNVYGVCVMCPTTYLEPGVVQANSTPNTQRRPSGLMPISSIFITRERSRFFSRSLATSSVL